MNVSKPPLMINERATARMWQEIARDVDIGIHCGAISEYDRSRVIALIYAARVSSGNGPMITVQDIPQ